MDLIDEKKRLQELMTFIENWIESKKKVPNQIIKGMVSLHEKAESRIREIDAALKENTY